MMSRRSSTMRKELPVTPVKSVKSPAKRKSLTTPGTPKMNGTAAHNNYQNAVIKMRRVDSPRVKATKKSKISSVITPKKGTPKSSGKLGKAKKPLNGSIESEESPILKMKAELEVKDSGAKSTNKRNKTPKSAKSNGKLDLENEEEERTPKSRKSQTNDDGLNPTQLDEVKQLIHQSMNDFINIMLNKSES